MHKTWSNRIIALKILTVRYKPVDKCAFPISWSRVNNEARRLVDDEEVGIFIEDVKLHLFGSHMGRFWGREVDDKQISLSN
jgi:hypothetical protein